MEITSLAFAGFVLLVFGVYHFLPLRKQNYWLLATSLAFYTAFDWRFPIILLVLSLANFTLAKQIEKRESGKLLWAGIILNVLALFGFKYADFYLPSITNLLNKLEQLKKG